MDTDTCPQPSLALSMDDLVRPQRLLLCGSMTPGGLMPTAGKTDKSTKAITFAGGKGRRKPSHCVAFGLSWRSGYGKILFLCSALPHPQPTPPHISCIFFRAHLFGRKGEKQQRCSCPLCCSFTATTGKHSRYAELVYLGVAQRTP